MLYFTVKSLHTSLTIFKFRFQINVLLLWLFVNVDWLPVTVIQSMRYPNVCNR